MNELTLYQISIRELESYADLPIQAQILFPTLQTSRSGLEDITAIQAEAEIARNLGLRAVLLWDTLMTDQQLEMTTSVLQPSILSSFDAVRVLDTGAAFWLKNHFQMIPIQLIVENSSLNLAALTGWCDLFSQQLERLILGNQLGIELLRQYCSTLPVKVELLGAGPLLAFSSPRKLLHPLLQSPANILSASISSTEAESIDLDVNEGIFGTDVFLNHDLFILDHHQTLSDMGIHSLRIDLRKETDPEKRINTIKQVASALTGAQINLTPRIWPKATSSFSFKNGIEVCDYRELKSKRQLLKHDDCLADVIAVQSEDWIVFYSSRSFRPAQKYTLIWPNGRKLNDVTLILSNIDGSIPEFISEGKVLCAFSWIKGICPGTCLLPC